MFKRLRVRFIALSMASLLLVLGVILGAANYLSYRHVVQNADEILDILAANGGTFPKPEGFGNEDNNTAPVFPMEPGQPGVWSEGETQPEPPSEAEAQPSAGTINPQPGILQPNPPTDGETLPWETPEVVWQSAPDEDALSSVLRQLDAEAVVTTVGQERNPFTYGIAKADTLIRGGNPDNMKFGDTLNNDQFPDYHFDYIISNPPFGIDWKREATAVEAEAKKGSAGRFGAGLPSKSDGQMLFLLNGVAKLKENGGRMAIIQNGSSLFTGDAGSGPSDIRQYLIEND